MLRQESLPGLFARYCLVNACSRSRFSTPHIAKLSVKNKEQQFSASREAYASCDFLSRHFHSFPHNSEIEENPTQSAATFSLGEPALLVMLFKRCSRMNSGCINRARRRSAGRFKGTTKPPLLPVTRSAWAPMSWTTTYRPTSQICVRP